MTLVVQLNSLAIQMNGLDDSALPTVAIHQNAQSSTTKGCHFVVWTRRTTLEKTLSILLFVLSLFLFVVILLYSHRPLEPLEMLVNGNHSNQGRPFDSNKEPAVSHRLCTTAGCVRAASHLLAAIESQVDPCDDFYSYACGRWNRNHPIPDDMSGYGTFSFVRERVQQQMRSLLEHDDYSLSKAIRMARTTYLSCMNRSELNTVKTRPLLDIIESLGHWPLMHNRSWRPDRFDLTALLATIRRSYGNEVFFSLYVYADAENTSRNMLYIDQGSLGLGRGSRDYYLNGTTDTSMFRDQLDAYRRYIYQVVRLIVEDADLAVDEDTLQNDLTQLVQFESSMAEIVVPEANRRNHTRLYNVKNLVDLATIFPQVEWLRLFSSILPADVTHLVVNSTEIVICEVEHLARMSELLINTDRRVLTNYVLWRFVQAWVKILDERVDDIEQDFLRVMTGQQQKSARWKKCVQGPTNWLPLASGSLYVRKYFANRDKKEALEMIGNLRESFAELVDDNDWMDEDTKQIALRKVASMINHIGYPEFIKNDTKLDDYYRELDISNEDNYFELVQKIVVWSQEREFRKLRTVFDKFEFEISPAVVNAFYSPEKNSITFPAGILQPPFFNGSFPKSINYGAIGAVIGHEITHGFDDQGSQFDEFGNLNNWWNPKSKMMFNKRKRCIIDQYSSYKVPGIDLNVNGKLTQGENIADNGGVKEAFRAYRKYVDKLGREEARLPGLDNLSNNQLFFLSYAHFWCGHKKRASSVQQVLTDEHSPEIFRVLGVVANLQAFSTAFSCASSTRLNPDKRCIVW